MICLPCSKAGDEHSVKHFKRAAHWHEKCEGCECQHKTGQDYVRRPGSKAPLMQTQSP